MKLLKFRSRGPEVHFLEELLTDLGYDVFVSNYFAWDTHLAVKQFQKENDLVIDGLVGVKTWSKLLGKNRQVFDQNSKLLSERDLEDFAKNYDLELAVVKAVNEVESNGRGFLADGRAKILFEGHIFWRELKKRGQNPQEFVSEQSKDILYPRWTKTHYQGGAGEYTRLNKATLLSKDPVFKEAAYRSASWGSFQIMGFNADSLGFKSIDDFVNKMQKHEREHLNAFGKFLEVNHLIGHLKSKNWAKFAKGYNGPAYAQNKYDTKLKKAYEKYS
ncbi:N-acetylmuramidase family protein [Echinicola jeungdonensis]|uniref:N-acetylmuramidase domain-containing protein n=1 Tax=Echinicola jeungdonensis TaxID=709343 RepID=A0ABV5J6W4_9BACT|nr:N-acetylmuramidase family protein [Echinicola jeungdonensis]MDN3670808.1 N-acetylmuramidase family protein [Echinicola jeungdonensis]